MGNHPSDFNIRKSWISHLFGGYNVAKKTTIDDFPIFFSHEQLHLSNIIQLPCWTRGYIQWNPYYSYQIRLSIHIYRYITIFILVILDIWYPSGWYIPNMFHSPIFPWWIPTAPNAFSPTSPARDARAHGPCLWAPRCKGHAPSWRFTRDNPTRLVLNT